MFFVALFASAMVFASACGPEEPEEPDNPTPPSTSDPIEPDVPDFADSDGYTIATSGIAMGNTEMITGETRNVSTAAELTAAFNAANPGDEIILAAGTYEFNTPQTITRDGAYNGYITVRAADGADVVLDFSQQTFDSTNRGIQLYGDYWHFYGIEVVGAGDNGMYIGGNYNIVEYCEFHNNRDTGLQIGRAESGLTNISSWPSYNLIKNCTSYNNYDNETKGENADGFAAKLTVGYGNVFDGCIAYRNSDDGWDLYAYQSNGDIGAVILYNCVAFENGYIGETVDEFNAKVRCNESSLENGDVYKYTTQNGDGNGFKLGGSVMRGNVKMYNCIAFNNRMHGVTDNSNPGVIMVEGVTSYNNGADIDVNEGSATFGQIVAPYSGGIGEGNNIDVARSETSHNNILNVLSVTDSYGGPGVDAYKGSATNSIFYAGGSNYLRISDYMDAYSEDADRAGEALSGGIVSADVFETLPFETVTDSETGEVTNEYAISGLENGNIHETYRNADESINMGSILAIADDDAVYGTGAHLNYDSWDDYTHFFNDELSVAASSNDSVLMAVYNTLYLYTDANAVYQDFTLTTSMMGATISWSSTNDEILNIVKSYNSSNSGSQDVAIEVYRPETDTKVTLTAFINYRGSVAIKRFDVTVKAANPWLGDIYVEGLENAMTEEARRFIIDQYEVFEEPELIVEDGSDMNGKMLADGTYDLEAVYEYATSATSTYSRVAEFSASVAGVYRITYNVTFEGDTASYTYYIYVASNTADIDFVEGTSQLIVNRDGYTLGGEVTNVKGTLHAYSTSDAAEIAELDGQVAAGAYGNVIEAIGDSAETYSFTNNSITAQFENENDEAYTVYYWFTNGAGELTSEVYAQPVAVETIGSTAEFTSKLANNNSSTIYLLTADLDFGGNAVTVSDLYGLLNGNGHTISNVTISGAGDVAIFGNLRGGTIMNVAFDEISLTSTSSRTGIFAYSRGGYISNVKVTNISMSTDQHAGALVGHHREGYLYIDNVSVVNDDEHVLNVAGQYSSGMIGLIQSSGAGISYGGVYISDCFVSAKIDGTGNGHIGSFIGKIQARNAEDELVLERCYSDSEVYGSNYVGGILNVQEAPLGRFEVNDCVFLGELYYAGNTEPLTMPEKNSSGIFGRYVEGMDVETSGCVSNITEHGFEEFVTIVRNEMAERESFWSSYVHNFDFENTWSFVDENADGTLEAPYIALTFGGIFD